MPALEELARGTVHVGVKTLSRLAFSPILSTKNSNICSSITAIILSGSMFGLIHLTNKHKARKKQAIAASFAGIVHAILQEQFGLAASIGAHIAANSFAIAADYTARSFK